MAELRSRDRRPVVQTALRGWEGLVTFYRYPNEHWVQLRTSNPIESIFSGLRLLTDGTRRLRCWDNALCLVFKMVERPSGHWRSLNGGENLMALVLEWYVSKGDIRQSGDLAHWHQR